MQKTESKSIQVHPNYEQYFIDVMQRFYWNLQSTQTVDTKESHIETRGDKLYSVTNTQKYVKLFFTGPMNFLNKEKFQQLQNEYFGYNFAEKNGHKGSVYLVLFGVFVAVVSVPKVCTINHLLFYTSCSKLFGDQRKSSKKPAFLFPAAA